MMVMDLADLIVRVFTWAAHAKSIHVGLANDDSSSCFESSYSSCIKWRSVPCIAVGQSMPATDG